MTADVEREWQRIEERINHLMPLLEQAAGLVGEARAKYHWLDKDTVPQAARTYILAMETHNKVCEKLVRALQRGVELMDG